MQFSDLTPQLVLRWATVGFVVALYVLVVVSVVLAMVEGFS